MRTALASMLLLMVTLSGCGGSAQSDSDKDRHFHDCVNAGGSYSEEYHAFSCDLPATVTVQPSPSPTELQ